MQLQGDFCGVFSGKFDPDDNTVRMIYEIILLPSTFAAHLSDEFCYAMVLCTTLSRDSHQINSYCQDRHANICYERGGTQYKPCSEALLYL